jgi:hypothetical protein
MPENKRNSQTLRTMPRLSGYRRVPELPRPLGCVASQSGLRTSPASRRGVNLPLTIGSHVAAVRNEARCLTFYPVRRTMPEAGRGTGLACAHY